MRFISLSIISLLVVLVFVSAIQAKPVPGEYYLGAYLGDQKIGYLTYKIEEQDTNGVSGYKISSIMNSQLKILGADLSQYVVTEVVADKDMNPLTQEFSMSSGGKTTKVSARYSKDKILCDISAGSGESTKEIPVPPGVKLIVDNIFGFSQPVMSVGSKAQDYYFNPLTLSIDVIDTTVERAEKITINGRDYDTIVLSSSTNLGKMTLWQNADGNIVQVEAMMGIRMVVEDREKAISGLGEGTQQDFAVLTSIKPDKEIPSPRKLKYLEIELKGIDDKAFVISDKRQTVVWNKQNNTAKLKIQVPTTVKSKATAPVKNPLLTKYLASTPYIDHNNPTVKKQSEEIIGKERNIQNICSKIRKWINDNMESQADIGITRSASDVLDNRKGVCRDYAILFAGLARSAGVPAKVVSGLVYADGAFYYHAWVECWTGKWTAYDATLSSDYVDATHIKLAEGDATSMFTLSRIIGGLKASVKSYSPQK